jgi:flagellar basal body P-ring formation protein FlgA
MKYLLALLLVLPVFANATTTDGHDDADAVVAAAQAAARARMGGAQDSAQLTVTGRPRALHLPKGERRYVARDVEGRWPRRRFTVGVDVFVDGHLARSVPVAFALSEVGNVLVYQVDLHAHASLETASLGTGQGDLARLRGTSLTDAAQVDGMRLRRGVRAGDAAVLEDFEAVPDIDSRQRVRIVASQGAIRLESGGLALRSGNRGDQVTVQVDGGDRPVLATVIDKGVAEVVR